VWSVRRESHILYISSNYQSNCFVVWSASQLAACQTAKQNMNDDRGSQGERSAVKIRDLRAEIERIKRGGDVKTKKDPGNDSE